MAGRGKGTPHPQSQGLRGIGPAHTEQKSMGSGAHVGLELLMENPPP